MTDIGRPWRRHHPATPDLADGLSERESLVLDLARTLHLWPGEIDLDSEDGRRRIAALVGCALRAQRRRSRAGHWSYDFACHARLVSLHRRILAQAKRPSQSISRQQFHPRSRRA